MNGDKGPFPDFFTTRYSIGRIITPIKFGDKKFYLSTIADREDQPNIRANLRPYQDNDEELLDCGDIEDSYEINLTKSGRYTTSIYIPSIMYPHIIGTNGQTLKSLRKKTGTVINVPSVGDEPNIVIEGETERKVASARNQIMLIALKYRARCAATHFVGLPVKSKVIEKNFNKFKDEIMKNPPNGVVESLFQIPEKFHLTFTITHLVSPEEVRLAKTVLEKCHAEIISNLFCDGKVRVYVKGLGIMNDDPSAVSVLYGNIHGETSEITQNLQKMANGVMDYFSRANLSRTQYDSVKLHMTLMNARYRKNNDNKTTPFDATSILEKFNDYYFGLCEISEIQLCLISGSGSQYYEVVHSVPL